MELNYPPELLNVVVVSDGSWDSTEAIARNYDRLPVQVLRVGRQQGRTVAQNRAASLATGEILIFTDTTTRLQSNAVRRLVENFADPSVGCVSGRLDYVTSYELQLRAGESLLGSLIGVSGCLYAVRRNAHRAIDPHLSTHFVIPMRMCEQGLRTVLSADAVCFEAMPDQRRYGLAMRVRVAVRSLNALIGERRFLNPLKYGFFACQLSLHMLRCAAPLIWLGALGANLVLAAEAPDPEYLILLVGQGLLVAAGSVGFLLRGAQRRA